MFTNYFKTAWRNIIKNKFSSIINIGGLAVGIGVSMVIGLWIWDELSFDKYHKQYDRIAQVMQHVTNNGEVQTVPVVPYPLANELRKNYGSDFTKVILGGGGGDHLLTVGDKKLKQPGSYFEPGITELLNLKMLKGSKDALKDPSSIILSQSAAIAFFGDKDPIDQHIKIDNDIQAKVAGVYEDLPDNSTFAALQFMGPWDLYFNNTNWISTIQDPWRPNAFQLYVQLAENANLDYVSGKIKDEKLKNVNAQLAKKKPALFLHPMNKWHLNSEFKDGLNTGGRIKYVWLFGIIGAFVLLLACINFMNLSTARSEKRAKEVGIRKAIGSLRIQLIGQFFSESILVVVISFILSLVFVMALLPFFNEVAGKKIVIPWSNPLFWGLGLVFSVITGLLAGSYPAFYFSSFKPVKILKGVFKAGKWSAMPRKTLVVLQFTTSVVMIIGTIIVFRQIQFAKNRPIGYETNGLIAVHMVTSKIHDHFDAVAAALKQTGTVLSMTETDNPVTETWSTSSGFEWKGKDPNLSIDFPVVNIAYDYGKTIGWEVAAGRDFSKDFASDSTAFILNEAAVKFMGFKEPIGESIIRFGESFKVVGVVKDLIMQSPYEQVRPTVFRLVPWAQSFVILKLNPSVSASDALSKIEPIFKQHNPEQPFGYSFVDTDYNKKFGDEERIGKLAGFFALLAIFISCLGLFGMASFMAEQRTKEIGIRKVLGASVLNVWRLLSKEFIVLVVIALLIAMPIAYYFMHDWLQSYQYRTAISWWIFAAAGAGALLITLLTVSFQAIKAALANPTKSLKTE
jgi:ABC-type antimicrobial peptide transport system permease subunit